MLECCTGEQLQDTYSSRVLFLVCCRWPVNTPNPLCKVGTGVPSSVTWPMPLLVSGRNWTQIFQKVCDLTRSLIIKESPVLLIKNTLFKSGDLEWGWEIGSLKSSKWFLFFLELVSQLHLWDFLFTPNKLKTETPFCRSLMDFMICQSLPVFSLETQSNKLISIIIYIHVNPLPRTLSGFQFRSASQPEPLQWPARAPRSPSYLWETLALSLTHF